MDATIRAVKRRLIGALLCAIVATSAYASCGAASCPIDLNALQIYEGFSLDLSYQYIDQDQPRIGTHDATIGEIPSDHNEIRTINRLTALQFAYSLSPSFQLAVTAPFVSRSHEHFDTGSAEFEKWNFGDFGDAVVQARMRVFNGNGAVEPSLWLTTGVKLPTGSTHQSGSNGENAEITMTPGTGSTDFLAGVTWQSGFVRDTNLSGPLGHSTLIPWFVAVNFRINGQGRDDYRRGNEIQWNAGTEYPIRESFHLLGQVNGRLAAKDDPGNTDEDPELTGGRYVYVSPGFRVMLPRGASFYALVQLPVYQNVNGLQLTSRANFIAGLHHRF